VVAALVAGTLVAAASPAAAKGPTEAVLRGPGVAGDGVATLDQHTAQDLAMATSLYSMFSGEQAPSRLVEREPRGALGPRYVVKFRFGGDGPRIRQVLYPFAEQGPIAHTPGGQKLCAGCSATSEGWFDVRYVALDILAAYRVPVPSSVRASEWPTARDDAHGLSISYPPSRHAAPSTLTPVQIDPVVTLAVGTGTLEPQRDDECGIIPTRALAAVGPTDALVMVYVTNGLASWSASTDRPTQFGPDNAWRVAATKCSDGVNPPTRSMAFELRGENRRVKITLMVAIGKDATPQRTAEVYAVLDSLRVE